MCLILISYDVNPNYRLILAANRDEYYVRPTQPLGFWGDSPDVLAGRDLQGDGTWLGVTRSGRLAAITNYRDPASEQENSPSRGWLVRNFLDGKESPASYLEQVKAHGRQYNGFNLFLADASGLYYFSNRQNEIKKLKSGLYGLSNHLIDTPWPKVQKGKAGLARLLSGEKEIDLENIFGLLADRSLPSDGKLPDTGIGLEKERMLSPLFVISSDYGTRSSSIILVENSGSITFVERTFVSNGPRIVDHQTRPFRFTVSPPSL
ncbi:NRDE family protein [Thermodesulfobacteriota bacterium]